MRSFVNPFRVPTDRQPIRKLRIAVVGAGYRGTNLAPNLDASPGWEVVAVCDLDMNRTSKLAATRRDIPVVGHVDDLLAPADAEAVAVLSVLEAVSRSLSLDGQASAGAGSEVADSELRPERTL